MSEDLVSTTKSYYDSPDADEFYYHVWGGEDIHVGLYKGPDHAIKDASKKTVAKMISMLDNADENTTILDIGAGYGGAARHIVSEVGCHVTCLNLSDKENARNVEKNKAAGLDNNIDVVGGNFEDLPFDDNQFDMVWCQDSILHSSRKAKVIEEVSRVIKDGGTFIFTDPMQSDDCPEGVLGPILERIHLEEMGSVKEYRRMAAENGFEEVEILEMPEQLINHYSRVKSELLTKKESLKGICSDEYMDRMEKGLTHWIEGGKAGHLNWGILKFRKKG